jgi:hypothetical protein
MKKFISALMAAVLALSVVCTGALAASLDNFKYSDTYKDGMFTDVASGAWYARKREIRRQSGPDEGPERGQVCPSGLRHLVRGADAGRPHPQHLRRGRRDLCPKFPLV